MRRVRAGRLTALAVCALTACFISACAERAPSPSPAPRPTTTASPAGSVAVRSASIDYYLSGPVDPVVEVRVVLENTHTRHTDSTTIAWDAEFARRFIFLRSEPAPWRTRIDERGWGTLDTDGVIPGQFATYRLWFAAATYEPLEPHLRIVANGDHVVDDVVARAGHLAWQVPPAQQRAFERGPLGVAAGAASVLPSGPRPDFVYALGLGVMLLVATLAGGYRAYRLAYHLAPR